MADKPSVFIGARQGAAAGKSSLDYGRKIIYDKVFDLIDEDGGGELEPAELKKALAALGEELTDEEIMDMIKEIDVDGNGSIDKDEFFVMIQNRTKDVKLLEAISRSFELFAESEEDSITRDEFIKIVQLGHPNANRTEVQELLACLPFDAAGKLEIQKFLFQFMEEL